jgi:hypothetical protein
MCSVTNIYYLIERMCQKKTLVMHIPESMARHSEIEIGIFIIFDNNKIINQNRHGSHDR